MDLIILKRHSFICSFVHLFTFFQIKFKMIFDHSSFSTPVKRKSLDSALETPVEKIKVPASCSPVKRKREHEGDNGLKSILKETELLIITIWNCTNKGSVIVENPHHNADASFVPNPQTGAPPRVHDYLKLDPIDGVNLCPEDEYFEGCKTPSPKRPSESMDAPWAPKAPRAPRARRGSLIVFKGFPDFH